MIISAAEAQRIWNTVQQPRRSSGLPSGYLLLLSALDKGWQVRHIHLRPSWDQQDFVYLVNLWNPALRRCQQIVLPKTEQVESLLMPYRNLAPLGHWSAACE